MKTDRIYIEHIAEALNQILVYTHNIDQNLFLENKMMQDAVIRQFEIIGEASKKISENTRMQYAKIPWKYMAGMRDKLIHDYIDVDLWIVYSTAKLEVPSLYKQIQEIVK